jgi:type IV secretory pathway VirB2 component (pilin)
MGGRWEQRRAKRNPEPHAGMMFREPKAINVAQVITNFMAAFAGFMAASGALPNIVTGQIGPVLSIAVGGILIVGGTLGGFAVLFGNWWLERVALLIVGLGWLLLLPACFSYAFSGKATTYQIWLIIALLFAALGDIFKRYLRIQWAYLDPRM